MSYFRSETMSYYQIVVPRESAWDVYNELGKIQTVEAVDMTPEEAQITRPFYPMIRRCDEIIGKFQLFENLMTEYRIKNILCTDYRLFLQNLPIYSQQQQVPEERWLEIIEHQLDEKYTQLSEQVRNLDTMKTRQNNLIEYKSALIKSKEVFGTIYLGSGGKNNSNSVEDAYMGGNQKQFALNYLIGVVDRSEALRFKRMVFRATKGNSWVSTSNIELSAHELQLIDEQKEEGQDKSQSIGRTIFIVVYQGGLSDFLKQKLNRICDSFGAQKFILPDDPTQLMIKAVEIDKQIDEADHLIRLTKQSIKEQLLYFSSYQKTLECSLIDTYRLIIAREKSIYFNLNTLHLKHSIYTGFFWSPTNREYEIHQALQALSKRKQNVATAQIIELEPPETQTVPTYFKVNEFTWAFQEIVNTYGMARYKEINPGLFAVIFFPFMFGIMFGDIGHGGVLLAVAIGLVKYSDYLKKDPALQPLAIGRYLFLLMGVFAFYCGFIYNDFMSLPWNLFGSCFKNIEGEAQTEWIEGCVYPIGFDPKWYIATNELNFFNSFKMKFSVIFGVLQMCFGIMLKGSNAFYFRNYVDFFCEFVPQIIFMASTFGYMCLLILIKWGQNWHEIGTDQAPSIINLMINIPLKGGETDGSPLYDITTQESIQAKILLIAFICVPWMLFPKPLILLAQSKQPQPKKSSKQLQPKRDDVLQESLLPVSQKSKSESKLAEELRRSLLRKQAVREEQLRSREIEMSSRQEEDIQENYEDRQILIPKQYEDEQSIHQSKSKEQSIHKPKPHSSGGGGHGHGHGEFEFSEIFVHQIIETIEFVLGSISNTASYLRLWALSLAHGQLAKVFFSKCLGSGIEDGSILVLVIGWPVFMHCTIGVLMMMDVMECFLHALRLQWVEFQNKFYKADGIKFNPFSFVQVMKDSRLSS